eukprot:COSAG02_NODE_2509_length_8631_cov_52.246484_7_plen_137_part_00
MGSSRRLGTYVTNGSFVLAVQAAGQEQPRGHRPTPRRPSLGRAVLDRGGRGPASRARPRAPRARRYSYTGVHTQYLVGILLPVRYPVPRCRTSVPGYLSTGRVPVSRRMCCCVHRTHVFKFIPRTRYGDELGAYAR